jgi:hydrogenase maturation protein HypF
MKTRLRVRVVGNVQGVGFRPFIFRLATDGKLRGWVNNDAQGVTIEVEGKRADVEKFLLRIEPEKPALARVTGLEPSFLNPVGYKEFEIRESDPTGPATALVLPDVATCRDCLREISDPANRRYRYPFTNCTHCGPRYSIVTALPYDRVNTTMRDFVMCEECRAEYENPLDRRFHAQPIACPTCGPHLELWCDDGAVLATGDNALRLAAEALWRGQIVALKGLGGFQLLVNACDEHAVQRLRRHKHREEKPFALMFPSLDAIGRACEVNPMERRLLKSSEAPIVLLRRLPDSDNSNGTNWYKRPDKPHFHPDNTPPISNAVAPGNPHLGAMLPYTPLHHLLMAELGFPVVATSGNLSDEPICTNEHEAVERLKKIGDVFLVHNRPIARHVDDSVVRVLMGREMVLRRARGYAPLPVALPGATEPTLAVGAHLKNTVALSVNQNVVVSQHIGDLDNKPSYDAFRSVIADLTQLHQVTPSRVVCDLHPDYISTQYAREHGTQIVAVQHHLAHVMACMAENDMAEPVLGVAWDGTGYGLDGTVWGGEFIVIAADQTWQRVAHLRTFPLPGGEAAVKEPRRAALGLLYEMMGDVVFQMDQLPSLRAFARSELESVKTMLHRRLRCPLTSSAGRLFDAVASLIDLRQIMRFEGQAAMDLEHAATGSATTDAYEFRYSNGVLDWEMSVHGILNDLRRGTPAADISARFHNTLSDMIVTVARATGIKNVVLTGGCFQNARLVERTVSRLESIGFQPAWHQRIPPNDGGIALGQIAAAHKLKNQMVVTARPNQETGNHVPRGTRKNFEHTG